MPLDPPREQGPLFLLILCLGVKLSCLPVQNLNEPPAYFFISYDTCEHCICCLKAKKPRI